MNSKVEKYKNLIKLLYKKNNDFLLVDLDTSNKGIVYNTACIFNPVLTKPIDISSYKTEIIDGLSTYSHPLMFKPSFAEVIESIPEEMLTNSLYVYILPESAKIDQTASKHKYQICVVLNKNTLKESINSLF